MKTKIPKKQLTLFDTLKYAGIKRDEVANIDEKEVIRLEKKLKAAQKLHSHLSMDAVEKAIEALKTSLPIIKYCYDEELLYHLFHRIRFKEYEFISFYAIRKETLSELQFFFSRYIEEDLLAEFKSLFKRRAFKELLRWQEARNMFTLSFKHGFQRFLKDRLLFIKETLSEKPSSWELRKKIPYARSGSFYKLLGVEDDPECERILYQILQFYRENEWYTKGRDFTDSILNAMYNYKPENTRFQASVMSTGFAYGGSNKVAILAAGSIFGFVGLVFLIVFKFCGPEAKPPRAFIEPTGTLEKMIYERDLRSSRIARQREARTCSANDCDSIYKLHDPFYRFHIKAGYTYTVITGANLKTGHNLLRSGRFVWPVGKGKQNTSIHNNTGQPLFLMVYISKCYYERWRDYHPCKYPIAYNKVFIRPGDSLAMDRNFDSLMIQTGSGLYMVEKRYEVYKDTLFAFCPFTKTDSLLYSNVFASYGTSRSINGKLIISKNENSYSIIWNGEAGGIYNMRIGEYLEPGKPVIIRQKKKRRN